MIKLTLVGEIVARMKVKHHSAAAERDGLILSLLRFLRLTVSLWSPTESSASCLNALLDLILYVSL